jgi:integrase
MFRTLGRGTGVLTRTPLPQANAYAMIQRRARVAGIRTRIGNHTFRATGITAYLERRHARESGNDRQPRFDPHDPALRPAQR